MKRKTDTTTATRVYSYGTVPARVAPVLNEIAAVHQMRLGQRLWNTLVAIDQVYTHRYRQIMLDENQKRVGVLTFEMDELRNAMNAARKTARSKSVDVSEIRQQIAIRKEERAALIQTLKDTKEVRHAARKAALDANKELKYRRIKRARQAAGSMGLFWGSYNDIVQRADAGRKLGELKFRGFRGQGTITAQIIGGAEESQCVAGSHTFFQIDGPTPGQKWRYARVRIGSNADRTPVWLQIPIVYHRNLPSDADIKSVSATRRVVAGKVRWQLNVTCSVAAPVAKPAGDAIAIDIGWRLLPQGVRVAYWADTRGEHGQVVVSSSDISQFGKIRSLQSICDRIREEIMPVLTAWFGAQDLSEEWSAKTSHLSQWRSSDRLAGLVFWWGQNRLPGDDAVFDAATAWRRQYLHLSQWCRNLQEQMTLRLREQYRVFGAQTARKYSAVVIENFKISDVAEKQPVEIEGVITAASTYRQMVSPSTFRGALINACKREGLVVTELPAEFTTRTCHLCGNSETWDQAESVVHRCIGCNTVLDQDYNAAMNLLRNWVASGEVLQPVLA